MRTLSIFLVVLATFFVAGAQALYKFGLAENPLFIILGLVSYGIGAALFILSLINNHVSALFPIFALNYVWVVVAAVLIFGESMNLMKGVGVLAIVLGVSAVGWSNG